ncbi:MAG: DUF4279 domain-containing protein [Elusimicrobia bacterium]|nr:DUF4279 domain-containing protein [Elusimicrobiota bacterium]
MQRETTVVRLRITSATLTAAEIEAKLGIKPDESWKIGDRTGTFGAILKDHGYQLDSTAMMTTRLEDHFRSMLKRIAPVAQKIGEISTQAKVEIVCSIISKIIPPVSFQKDDLRWMAAMGASLEVEISMLVDRNAQAPAAKKPGDKEGPASVF